MDFSVYIRLCRYHTFDGGWSIYASFSHTQDTQKVNLWRERLRLLVTHWRQSRSAFQQDDQRFTATPSSVSLEPEAKRGMFTSAHRPGRQRFMRQDIERQVDGEGKYNVYERGRRCDSNITFARCTSLFQGRPDAPGDGTAQLKMTRCQTLRNKHTFLSSSAPLSIDIECLLSHPVIHDGEGRWLSIKAFYFAYPEYAHTGRHNQRATVPGQSLQEPKRCD